MSPGWKTQSLKAVGGFVGAGAQTPPLHDMGGPLGAHARTFFVHFAGGTIAACTDAVHEPPVAVTAKLT